MKLLGLLIACSATGFVSASGAASCPDGTPSPAPSPTTPTPTTPAPTTPAPTTPSPTTPAPTTPAPTTPAPNTPTPTTPAPTTPAPTTPAPTTPTPTTPAPTPTIPQCGIKEEGFNYFGDDINALFGVTLQQCCDACSALSGCKAYTYAPYGNLGCYLKWGTGDKRASNDTSSSIVVSKPTNCTYAYATVYSGEFLRRISTANLDACCMSCQATPGCKAFSLYYGSYCDLYSSRDAGSPQDGVRSGFLNL